MAERKLDLRPNSEKSKQVETMPQPITKTSDETNNDLPVKKDIPKPNITKGAVKKKSNLFDKAVDTFLQGRNFADVGHYVLCDVLVPKIIDGLASAGKAAIDGIFYGDGAKAKSAQSQGNNKYNYSSVSRGGVVASGGRNSNTNNSHTTYHKVRRGFENVTIESRLDAENMLEYLRTTIDKYESVSIADFYDGFDDDNIVAQYTDNNWGWFSLDNVGIRHVPGGWQIDFPEPVKLG